MGLFPFYKVISGGHFFSSLLNFPRDKHMGKLQVLGSKHAVIRKATRIMMISSTIGKNNMNIIS